MMASALYGNSCGFSASASCSSAACRLMLARWQPKNRPSYIPKVKVRASSEEQPDDCNTEECAPDKEVGTVSMEWLAGEKTRVVGTYPPRNKGWTGYIEKDTAGQKNIYSVEPAVYVAESAISSGSAGSSAEGSGNTVAIISSIALISIAAASAVVLQVGKNPSSMQTTEYSGPSLSYYINKFKPQEIIEAAAPPPVAETSAKQVSQADEFGMGFPQATSPLASNAAY